MDALQWNAMLATGIQEIDEQHKRIVEMVNQLREAIERGERKAAEWVLLQMVDYTVYHFEFEERLMERAGYRYLPLHQRVHQLFIKRIPQFQQRYSAGENVLHEVHNMLARWLAHHIHNDDRDYADAVKAYLQQEAQKSPANYAPTEPMPLHEAPSSTASAPAPAPIEDAERMARHHTRRGFWERLSGFMSADF